MISQPRSTNPQPLRQAAHTETIWIVDARAGDYQDCRSAAEAKGAEIQLFGRAHDALRLARGASVDLWVINAEQPAGMSGFELCALVKELSPDAAVFLVADEYSSDCELRSLQARATLFACKPGHDELLAHWLEHRRSQRQES
jgi:DNA-binding response OmpR family regulator